MIVLLPPVLYDASTLVAQNEGKAPAFASRGQTNLKLAN